MYSKFNLLKQSYKHKTIIFIIIAYSASKKKALTMLCAVIKHARKWEEHTTSVR